MDAFADFAAQARRVLALEIITPVNRLGGFGQDDEVIYSAHPRSCPSSLTMHQGNATLSVLTNGSTAFQADLPGGFSVDVLRASYDVLEKRETGPLAHNCWLEIGCGANHRTSSLLNPSIHSGLPAAWIKIIKTTRPSAGMWFCSGYHLPSSTRDGDRDDEPAGAQIHSVMRLRLTATPQGPALQRDLFLFNPGETSIAGNMWTYFDLRGTQRFSYHKPLWYDRGMALNAFETVAAGSVPQEDALQIKRVSSQVHPAGAEADAEGCVNACAFIGDTGACSALPQAVLQGSFLEPTPSGVLNRFSTPTLAANRFAFRLDPGQEWLLLQSLALITEPALIHRFAEQSATDDPRFLAIEQRFRHAASELTLYPITMPKPGINPQPTQQPGCPTIRPSDEQTTQLPDYLTIRLPHHPAISAYLNQAWQGVDELYEKCRAHGAVLADGIELGTRDRAQDMLAKVKSDPARVRADLIHALGFCILTQPDLHDYTAPLTLSEKLHGMYPRQYPSRWLDRSRPVKNDNRPYADSPLWLLDALCAYLHETGDISILAEQVSTVRLVDPLYPETSALVGDTLTQSIFAAVCAIFDCYRRHAADSPYGLAQILYGDWCDPVDMLGSAITGDPATRSRGRGAALRLSIHLFLCLVEWIDLLASSLVQSCPAVHDAPALARAWSEQANALYVAVLRWGWEEGETPGFIDCIHEQHLDGTAPDITRGERGYTFGSLSGSDFDGLPRRVLTAQAYGLALLSTRRPYLHTDPYAAHKIAALLAGVERLFYSPQLGLRLLSAPVANNEWAVRYVGRLGLLPPGCAENGEYHHAQTLFHRFRLDLPGQADAVWAQLIPILSVSGGATHGGPFDLTCNSYASDPADPHFGKGMYFGLSGSIDWLIEIVQKFAGVTLNLHNPSQPAVRIEPCLPAALQGELIFKRVIHRATETSGVFRQIPLTVCIRPAGVGEPPTVRINGQLAACAEIPDLRSYSQVDVEIIQERNLL